MKRVLIIVDMQNDFIDEALANPSAKFIVPNICSFIKEWQKDENNYIVCTFDTHQENYLETTEGKLLPVKHCIEGTNGWCLNSKIAETISCRENVYKPTFGYKEWDNVTFVKDADEIVMCGTCTDICVVSNALILKATFPDKKITVMSELCAGLTKEKHEAALETMRSCQIEVK